MRVAALMALLLMLVAMSGCIQHELGLGLGQGQGHEHGTTLDGHGWRWGIPPWEVLNTTAQSLTRANVSLLKGAVGSGLYPGGHGAPMEQNLAMRDRIHANVYEVRLTLIYRDGGFYPPGPEGQRVDDLIRAKMAEGILAKRAGLAVHLSLGFMPEGGFQSTRELYTALDGWEEIVENVAPLAEKYRFEYLNPCGELDHLIRTDSKLDLPESTTVEIFNEYHPRYVRTARHAFSGTITTQLGDVYPDVAHSIMLYDLSGVDMIGMLTGSRVCEFDEELFRRRMSEDMKIMRRLCDRYNTSWYISEVWFYDEKPATQERLERQAACFDVLFDVVRSTNITESRGPMGILIMNWNMQEEDIFADIMDRPAEHVVAEFFGSWATSHPCSCSQSPSGSPL